MIILSERTALDYAATNGSDGKSLTMKMADLEANRVMKNWMAVPEDIHYLAQELENDKDKWKSLLHGTYKIPESEVPVHIMKPVIEAFKSERTKNDLSNAIHKEFSFIEFNNARKKLAKDKSPGPSGVTNNQMRSWNEKITRAIYDLASIMWKYHAVPQFWQDRLMTLLPKTTEVNDLAKVRPSHCLKTSASYVQEWSRDEYKQSGIETTYDTLTSMDSDGKEGLTRLCYIF